MHWKMVQGCIDSVKNSGKVNLSVQICTELFYPYGFWIKESISAFKI